MPYQQSDQKDNRRNRRGRVNQEKGNHTGLSADRRALHLSSSGVRGGGSAPAPAPAPEEKPAAAFADVPDGAYCADAVAWAADKGIAGGTDETHFSPKAPCTRAQMVTFLYRLMGEA